VDGLSLREVARRAGVSQAAPYHHFPDKAALVAAIVERGYADLEAALRAGADAGGATSLDRLRGVGVAYVRFATVQPAMFRLLFRPERWSALVAEASDAHRAGLAAYGVLVDSVTAAHADGLVVGPVETVALVAWSTVHGLATLLIDGPLGETAGSSGSAEQLAAAATGLLTSGIAAR
jgi:AcrR family transcriptional regulator